MKSILLLTLFVLFQHSAYGWTLNRSTKKGFNKNKIVIYIANTDCSNAGFSASHLVTLIKESVEDYWNSVPSSALKLEVKGLRSDIDISSDTHATARAKIGYNQIIAGCNDNTALGFDNGSILGSAQSECSGDNCKSAFILNAHANTNLKNFQEHELKAIIAHEIGHSIGLGHSEYKYALMYYAVGGKYQQWLSMDDINGVSALYPHESNDLFGVPILSNCGSIDINPSKTHHNSLISFFAGLLMMMLLLSTNLLKRLIVKYL